MELPLVDVGPLMVEPAGQADVDARRDVARRLDQACRRFGFVRISGHGVPAGDRAELERLSRAFFARSDDEKAEIAMARAGSAWRGWFPVGAELTSGRPDGKEGVYFGAELAADDPRVRAGTPLHGANLFPTEPAGLAPAVRSWMGRMEDLGQRLLGALGDALGVGEHWFATHVTTNPTTLFRIFHYPPHGGGDDDWGVREHTDYGLLTVLAQDASGGLQVRAPSAGGRGGWIDVPAEPDVLIVNLGDMLERMTKGLYRSTPHRVRNAADHGRLSFPFFLDPDWDATVTPLPAPELDATDVSAGPARWDGADVHAWNGRYGDYLTAKVARVFPDLFAASQPSG